MTVNSLQKIQENRELLELSPPPIETPLQKSIETNFENLKLEGIERNVRSMGKPLEQVGQAHLEKHSIGGVSYYARTEGTKSAELSGAEKAFETFGPQLFKYGLKPQELAAHPELADRVAKGLISPEDAVYLVQMGMVKKAPSQTEKTEAISKEVAK